MDVDWCLSCERRLHDLPSPSGPYCSPRCLSSAQPPVAAAAAAARVHTAPLAPSSASRIRQWAQAIPPHIPAGAPALPFVDLPLPSSPSVPAERPPSPRPRTQPTPKLIERTAVSTPLPTLCVSNPAHVRPPHPPRAHSHAYSTPNTSACMSEASTSLTSLLSEPMVATPDEDASFGANIGALVRSWVHCDRPKSAKEDCVIEKVTDYFPPLPQGRKPSSSPSSSKKPKRTLPRSVSRHKLPTTKVQDRDRPTSAHSHTPTPVIFPSCRAAELDWVDAEEEDKDDTVVAPQPQYHPSHYRKHDFELAQWARVASLSSLSSDSSILLMAPKARDAIRGRNGTQATAP